MSELWEAIKKANPNLPLFRASDLAFREYGRVLHNIDSAEMIAAAQLTAMPESGSAYDASLPDLEACGVFAQLRDEYFGEMDIQIGYCRGFNSQLNALEWHKSSEINMAVTPLVLLLGRVQDIRNGRYDSSKVKGFFLEKGDAVEIFGTTLHFCPCQVLDNGFGCVVVLPKGTNLPLEQPAKENSFLFRKNKWLLAHEDNRSLIERGAQPGVFGENICLIK